MLFVSKKGEANKSQHYYSVYAIVWPQHAQWCVTSQLKRRAGLVGRSLIKNMKVYIITKGTWKTGRATTNVWHTAW